MTQWQNHLNSIVDGKKIFVASVCIEDRATGNTWQGVAGDLNVSDQYFIASTTKLYVTALILMLEEEAKLSLWDRISNHLSKEFTVGLHAETTIQHLLAHTSGIADYFQSKPRGERSLEQILKSGEDRSWTTEGALAMAVKLGPRFYPGQKNKAHYSDTNYQLLGKIIENVENGDRAETTRVALSDIMNDRIFKPLALSNTYLYDDPKDQRPVDFYYRKQRLHLPMAMVSFGPDGGIVSTALESLRFLTAFFDGRLFKKKKRLKN